MPSRTARYAHYSPRQRRRRLLADRSVRFPNDVLFLDHIRQGDLEQVGRFIRTRKVSLDTIYPSGLAALHEAVLSGNLECVKLLVKYGADIHQRDETGWTPLHIACSDGYPDIARAALCTQVPHFPGGRQRSGERRWRSAFRPH
ncbi:PREDICTED: protein phosphatase 1 regulatory subunit 27 isoform X2 [Bison bison bison]|uniref:Protein phosphatase 1 regulatory subunit 27 isoform X2 n=1 Tax=Bison bison bison TaxID=43346 RepID=A0A6P3IJU2_BISBB|nr:PREDICTED: protein phosphatase 1 regulatory subunit 27 isoform X2 [Bison bison bison]